MDGLGREIINAGEILKDIILNIPQMKFRNIPSQEAITINTGTVDDSHEGFEYASVDHDCGLGREGVEELSRWYVNHPPLNEIFKSRPQS